MKNLTILILILFCSCSPIHKLYNNFGEFKNTKHYSDSNIPIRLFFDRWGDLYPEFPIEGDAFLASGSVLERYYENNIAELKSAFGVEQLAYSEKSSVAANIGVLQDHLNNKNLQKINNLSKGKKLIFLIHGYNNTGESASAALENLRVAVVKKFPKENFQFVEVYWDGLTRGKHALNSSKIWNNAQYSAAMAGLGLRRILNKLDSNENYVITHSHGAGVITEALFNVRRFRNEYYLDDEDGKEIARLQAAYDTPTSKFSIGMLAPAIPGENVFREYYHRTSKGETLITGTSNYRFINGFNRYDIATTKGFLAYHFGSTSLACKEKEHEKVAEIFNNESIYSRIDFSADTKHKQRSHAVVKYIANPSFEMFLSALIQ